MKATSTFSIDKEKMDVSPGGVGEVRAAVGLSANFRMRSCHKDTHNHPPGYAEVEVEEQIISSIRIKAGDTWPIPTVNTP